MARHSVRNVPDKEKRSLRRLVISVASALFPTLTLERRDNGAGATQLELYHRSASPANNDEAGTISFDNTDSNITRENVAEISLTGTTVTAGAEDCAWELYNNSGTTFLFGGNGVYWSGLDGQSPPGAIGEMNCAGYYLNGERFPLSTTFKSTQQTLVNGGLVTVAHGLGATPRYFATQLECVIAEGGFSIGDVIIEDGSPSGCMTIYADATNVYVRYFSTMSGSLGSRNKTTGAFFLMTFANWRLVVKAYL